VLNFLFSGITALHVAAALGHASCVSVLLRAGAEANPRRDNGRTALHAACAGGHTAVVQLLLDAGAEVIGTVVLLKLSRAYSLLGHHQR